MANTFTVHVGDHEYTVIGDSAENAILAIEALYADTEIPAMYAEQDS